MAGCYSAYPKELCDETGRLKNELRYEGNAHVYETRWKMMADAFNTLEEQTLDAQVEWGADFLDVIIPLRKCKVELLIAVQDHLGAMKEPHLRRQNTAEESNKQMQVLYYTGEDSRHDQFTKQINPRTE